MTVHFIEGQLIRTGLVLWSVKGAPAAHFNLPLLIFYLYTTFKSGKAPACESIPAIPATSDMTWNAHISYTVKRVNGIIWQLVRFKQLGASQEKLQTFYILKIHSILMFASVCFHSSLTKELSQKLELQQQRCLAVILGSQYRSYSRAIALTRLPRLDTLRSEVFTKWAIKALKDPLNSNLFPLNTSTVNTRFCNKFTEYICYTKKYYKSTVPNMIRSLNIIFSSHDKL